MAKQLRRTSSAPQHIEEEGIDMISEKEKIGVKGEDLMENAITVVKQATEKLTADHQQKEVMAEHQRDPSQHQMGGEGYRPGPRTGRITPLKHLGWP